jgi:type IV pilus assembly protein PilO
MKMRAPLSARLLELGLAWRDWMRQAVLQVRQLDRNNPWSWPAGPRTVLCVALGLALVLLLWVLWLRLDYEQLQAAREQELRLRQEYVQKVAKLVNRQALEQQRQQVEQFVQALEKQLPSKAEMDALLFDINQAGLGRGLAFELFKPGPVVELEHYAEQSITLRVVGGYHAIGSFVADVARLPRIVTLTDLALVQDASQSLVLDATAKTYRYREASERRRTPSVGGKARKGRS